MAAAADKRPLADSLVVAVDKRLLADSMLAAGDSLAAGMATRAALPEVSRAWRCAHDSSGSPAQSS